MTYILLHNPSCGTSKKGLALLQEKGIEPSIRKYMNVSERLSVDELKDIAAMLGADTPRAFLRKQNAERAGIPEDASDQDLYLAMAADPGLIQRPIGINNKSATLGRPVEKLLEII